MVQFNYPGKVKLLKNFPLLIFVLWVMTILNEALPSMTLVSGCITDSAGEILDIISNSQEIP